MRFDSIGNIFLLTTFGSLVWDFVSESIVPLLVTIILAALGAANYAVSIKKKRLEMMQAQELHKLQVRELKNEIAEQERQAKENLEDRDQRNSEL